MCTCVKHTSFQVIQIDQWLCNYLGILTQRWKLIQGLTIGDPKNIEKMVAAACVLHNYLCIHNDRTYLPPGPVDAIYGEGDNAQGQWRAERNILPQAAPTAASNHTLSAANARTAFTEYFMNEGAVDWQNDYIHRRTNAR